MKESYKYKDEVETLRNENARLRNEIGRLQVMIADKAHKNSQLRQIILGNEEEMSGMKDSLNEAQRLLSDWVSDKPSTVSEHKDLISDTDNLLKELYL